MEGLERILREHPFFAGASGGAQPSWSPAARAIIVFHAGQYLFREGEAANEFFLIRHGQVALEIAAPGRAPIVFATLGRRRDRRRVLAGPALSLDVRCARRGTDARDRHRRRLPAREMRGGPRPRLRDDEALPARRW